MNQPEDIVKGERADWYRPIGSNTGIKPENRE